MTRDFIGSPKAEPGLTKEHRQRLRARFKPSQERVDDYKRQGHGRALAQELATREVVCDGVRDAKDLRELKEAVLAHIINSAFRHGDK